MNHPENTDAKIKFHTIRINREPQNPEAFIGLGNALHDSGNHEQAVKCFKKALELDPENSLAYHGLGNALLETKDNNAAIAAYQNALRIAPNNIEAHINLGLAFSAKEENQKAIESFNRAIKLSPANIKAHINLGNTFMYMNLLDNALECYKNALIISPDNFEACTNMATALKEKKLPKEALIWHSKSLEINPDYPEAHFNRALTLLLLGNFKEGWEEHEWRWKKGDYLVHRRDFSQPRWDGSDIKGKTILLHAEQGYGDTLQFIRYAPLIAQMGAKVIVECQPALVSLLKNTEGVNAAVSKGEAIPDFDLHCPVLSLPLAFKTELSSIPANIPYIRPSEEIIAKWKKRIGGNKDRLKVGISWAGNPEHRNDRNRSCGFEVMKQLLDIHGIDFYNLQVLNKAGGVHPKLIDFTEEIRSFEDTAGLISSLDLIVAVDTAVGHLGGAMGKEVWMMLPY